MGVLYLCSGPRSEIPFRLEGLQLNIYSLEELCYYIKTNTLLLDHSFMSVELCTWLDKEMGKKELSAQLGELVSARGRLSDFVEKILMASGYCTREEIRDILFVIHQMETKSEFECGKIRADKLAEGCRYIQAIYEYRRLLESEDAGRQNRILLGNIRHNLGTCYARLFLFREAAACYLQAYRLNGKMESLKELLYSCMGMEEADDKTLIQMAAEFHIDANALNTLRGSWKAAQTDKNFREFSERMDQLENMRRKAPKAFEESAGQLLLDWKKDYRRICGN